MKGLFKQNKYNAKKTIIDGITFASLAEAEYYMVLKHQERLGLIKDLELQPKYYLSKARILYIADFKFTRDGETLVVDVKGPLLPVFNIKARLWKAYQTEKLEIVKKSGRHFEIVKTIGGKNE